MTKRADGRFARKDHDAYATPADAVLPLLDHLLAGTRFVDPCDDLDQPGALIKTLEKAGHHCVGRYGRIMPAQTTRYMVRGVDCFVTNPPWRRDVLHGLIENLSDQKPTWLLFDADWMHTIQAARYLHRLVRIVSVGRVKWIAGSASVGFDNCCWYLFTSRRLATAPIFFGRTIPSPNNAEMHPAPSAYPRRASVSFRRPYSSPSTG
jgi:hypothetical protein